MQKHQAMWRPLSIHLLCVCPKQLCGRRLLLYNEQELKEGMAWNRMLHELSAAIMIRPSPMDIHQETSGVKWLRLKVCTSLNVFVLLNEGWNGDVYLPFVRIWVTEPLQSSNAIFSILRRIQVLVCAVSTDRGCAAKCAYVDGKRI